MADNLTTENGRREDLEAIEVNAPQGYIGARLFPKVAVGKQAGKMYYASLVADSAAQTNRSAGAAPTSTILGATNTDYSCTEIIKRYAVPFEVAANLGGIEAADRKGALASKRMVLRTLEDLYVDEVMAGTPDAHVSSNLIDVVTAGKNAIKRYSGRTAFVCSEAVFGLVMKQADVVKRLARFGSIVPADNAMVLALNRQLLAMVLEVDEVLIGDDAHWHVTTAGAGNNVSTKDRALVCKLPDVGEDSQDMDPVLGKSVIYIPTGANLFTITAYADNVTKANLYDAQIFKDVVTFNAAAAYLIDDISANSGS